MLKTLLLLTVLALVQARPSDDVDPTNARLYEFHEDCPPTEVHFLLPHEYDCTKFYYCEYGLKWIEPRDCAPGTEFNAEIQVCVHPISSGCTLPGYATTPEDETPPPGTAPTIAPTAAPTTPEVTTPEVITPAPTTPEVITTEPTTPAVTTSAPTTPVVTTSAPTTPEVTTSAPTTPEVTTSAPTTSAPTTSAPTTSAPTTSAPTTSAPTTSAPTTSAPTTSAPTTSAPTTSAPTTPEVTTSAPTTSAPTTSAPTTSAPTTSAPATSAPTTSAPTTPEVTTSPPTNPEVTTSAPTNPEVITTESTAPGVTTPATTNGPVDPNPPTVAPSTSAPDTDDFETLDNGCPSDIHIHKLLPHEEYCHKFYYCDKGQLVLRYCAPGTYFNPKLEVCDWPHNVDCVNDGSYEYPTTSAPATQPPSPPGDGDNDIGDILDNGCPADFDVHHLLPHETECNKFYYCVFGQKVERSCAPGTYFNYEIQVCDWPANVNCTSTGTTPGGPPDDTSSSEELPIVSDPEVPEDPIEWVPLPNGCPANFDVHHLLPHETDCDKFYYCVNGQILERECPPGTHFSPSQQICDWPQYAGCEHWDGGCSDDNCAGTTAAPGGNDGTTAAPGGNDGTTAAPGGNDGTTAAPGGNDGTTAAPGGNDGTTAAPGGNDGTTAAPGSNDGTTAAPGGTDGTTAAPGGNDGTTAAPGGTDGTTAAPGGNDGTTAAPGGNDGTTAAPGSNDGTTAAPGGNDGTTAAPGGNDGTTAAPGENDGTTAAPGGNDGTTAAPGGNDGTTAAPGGNDGTTAAPGGNDGTTAAPDCDNCRPVTPEDRCKSECNVLPFVHDDCDKYWICNGDQPLMVTCSEGLHFNPSTYTCDFICNAGCLRENVQITTVAEGVKVFLPWGSITSDIMNMLDAELNADL